LNIRSYPYHFARREPDIYNHRFRSSHTCRWSYLSSAVPNHARKDWAVRSEAGRYCCRFAFSQTKYFNAILSVH